MKSNRTIKRKKVSKNVIRKIKKMKTSNINIIQHSIQSNHSNREYTVLQDGENFICDCKGFAINHSCKHIREAQSKILFFKEKENLKMKLETEIQMFISKYQTVPQIKVSKKGSVSIKFIF